MQSEAPGSENAHERNLNAFKEGRVSSLEELWKLELNGDDVKNKKIDEEISKKVSTSVDDVLRRY